MCCSLQLGSRTLSSEFALFPRVSASSVQHEARAPRLPLTSPHNLSAELHRHDIRVTRFSGCICRADAVRSPRRARQLNVYVTGGGGFQRLVLYPLFAGRRASLDDDVSRFLTRPR